MAQLKLTPNLSPLGAWAFSIGTSIGWGSLVVSRNYYYMMRCFPSAGGAYVYARECFGHDHGFLVSWFLALTYLAVLWANATALPLFGRFFMGTCLRSASCTPYSATTSIWGRLCSP
ncbi:MAG: APC family permease [Abditibacteriota bacterium]|nr:APC family permease [Abditibacteriota bacterium]